MQLLKNIPTNIITGFLGVGKTTAILHLLEQKPEQERWAVLVNEFGEIGLDGALIAGALHNANEVFIREVPGGCMCCAAGLPMQTALNVLLNQSRPDRLIIEPTGLGHPKEVLSTLASVHYRNILNIEATLTLVDARKIKDERYTRHEIFLQQLDIADVIVANKTDQYQQDDFAHLTHFLTKKGLLADKALHQTAFGKIDQAWLTRTRITQNQSADRNNLVVAIKSESMIEDNNGLLLNPDIPDCGYLVAEHANDEFHSMGWRFKPEMLFDRTRISLLLSGIDAERVKAIVITTEGIFGFNIVDGVQTEVMLQEAMDSRIEMIVSNRESLNDLTTILLQCLKEGSSDDCNTD
jgi:G3E family GTPase